MMITKLYFFLKIFVIFNFFNSLIKVLRIISLSLSQIGIDFLKEANPLGANRKYVSINLSNLMNGFS